MEPIPRRSLKYRGIPLPDDAGDHLWFRHIVSSTAHVACDGSRDRLKCGRLVTCNFEQVRPQMLDRVQSFFCVQCSRHQEW